MGAIFAREHKPPEARETRVDARGKRRAKRGREVCVGVPSGGFAVPDRVFKRRISVEQGTVSVPPRKKVGYCAFNVITKERQV